MEPRTIIDALEDKYGSSRSAAQAIMVPFTRYLEWIVDPETMPHQVKVRLMFFAGLTPGAIARRRRVGSEECCGGVVNG